MSLWVNIITISTGLFIIFVVFQMLKKHKFSEMNSIAWLAIAVVLTIVGFRPSFIYSIADFFGVQYPPTSVIVMALIFILLVLFRDTVLISELSLKVQELTMQVSILKGKQEEIESKMVGTKEENKREQRR